MGVLERIARPLFFTCAGLLVVSGVSAGPLIPAASCRADDVRAPAASTGSQFSSAGPALRLVSSQPRRNDKAGLTMGSRATSDGVQIEARGPELSFKKKVRPNGSFSLTLATPRDAVQIEFSGQTVSVTRGAATASLGPSDSLEADLGRIQRLVADSPALRQSRQAAAAIEESEDDSPEASAVLMSDALVGMLTGDLAAPGRVARHLSRHVRAKVRQASLAPSCYQDYESQVYTAWVDYEDCLDSIATYNPIRWGCSLRYIVWAEATWFQFLSCVGLSGMNW